MLKPNLQLAVKEFESELMANVVLSPHLLPPKSDETLQLSLLQTTSQYLVAANMTADRFEVKGHKGMFTKFLFKLDWKCWPIKKKFLLKDLFQGP